MFLDQVLFSCSVSTKTYSLIKQFYAAVKTTHSDKLDQVFLFTLFTTFSFFCTLTCFPEWMSRRRVPPWGKALIRNTQADFRSVSRHTNEAKACVCCCCVCGVSQRLYVKHMNMHQGLKTCSENQQCAAAVSGIITTTTTTRMMKMRGGRLLGHLHPPSNHTSDLCLVLFHICVSDLRDNFLSLEERVQDLIWRSSNVKDLILVMWPLFVV